MGFGGTPTRPSVNGSARAALEVLTRILTVTRTREPFATGLIMEQIRRWQWAHWGLAGITALYTGVYDLSGNVFEWEDSCNGSGASAPCRVRGGAWYTTSANLTCSYVNGGNTRNSAFSSVGFRCCAP